MMKTKEATRKASFIEAMECLPVAKLPAGPEWTYEILCGGPHKISFVASGVRDAFLAREANVRSPTPHDYQRLRRNCISATSSFQCFWGTAPRTSHVASALAFISRSTSA